MSDETALRAAILANPDEDTPRLAYADWLDEYGDDDARGRAEFIRLQIEFARGGLTDRRRATIDKRCEALQKKYRKVWLAPFLAACQDERITQVHRRGFICDISGRKKLPERFPAIAAVCPVQRVDIDFEWFMDFSPDWALMGDSPALASLRRLECRRFGETFARAVLGSPHLTGLQTLYLQWGWLEKGIELVNRSPVAQNLRHLWIWGASAGSNTPGIKMGTVLDAPWPALTQMRLDNLSIGESGVLAAVREAAKRKWHALHVHDYPVTRPTAIPALELAVAGYPLSLSVTRDCDLNEPPEPVAEGVKLLALRAFSTEGDALIRWIIANVPPGRFNRIAVRHCRVSSTAVRALVGWPGLAQLEELDLRANQVCDRGAAALAETPHLENLKRLRLADNNFTDKGKAALKKRFSRRVRIAD